MKTKMKIKLTKTALIIAAVSFSLSACASAPEEEIPQYSDSSYQEEEKAYVYSDENSVLKVGDNGVTTITVTLNDGSKVECVEYNTLVCFPELSVPR